MATVLQRLDLADRVALEQAPHLRIDGFAQDTLVRAALETLADAAGVPPRWRARITKKIPVAAGLGGGSSDAATALRLANAMLDEPLAPGAPARPRPSVSAPTCRSSSPTAPARRGRRTAPHARSTCRRTTSSCWSCRTTRRRVDRGVYERFDARAARPDGPERRASLAAALARNRPPARPRGPASERPRLVAARRRAACARRLPGRRQGAGPSRLRALPPSRRGACREARSGPRGRVWLTVPCWYG